MDTDKSAAALPAEHSGADQDAAAIGEHADQFPSSKANATTANGDDQATTNGQKPNPKDPSRPRRKKARRACFACQRAHLTCGTLSSTLPR
jgi:hypothetical protein